MTIDIIKRLMDGLNLSHEEAQVYYAKMIVTCAVEDLMPDDEIGAGSVWRGCIGGRYVAPVAAQYSMIHVRNWPGSGVYVVVDRLVYVSAGTSLMEVWEDATGYAATSAAKGFTNLGQAGAPTAQVRYGNNVAHQGDLQVGHIGAIASTPTVIEGPWHLDGGVAGQAIGIEHSTVNTGLTVLFFWRERDYNPAA